MNLFIFSARNKSWDKINFLWYPSLHSVSGKNLEWQVGFRNKEDAIGYIISNFERIREDWF